MTCPPAASRCAPVRQGVGGDAHLLQHCAGVLIEYLSLLLLLLEGDSGKTFFFVFFMHVDTVWMGVSGCCKVHT